MKNAANVEQKAIFFLQLNPVVTPTRFCSAIKHSIKLYLYDFIRVMAKVEFFVSPSKATTFGLESLAFFNPSP